MNHKNTDFLCCEMSYFVANSHYFIFFKITKPTEFGVEP